MAEELGKVKLIAPRIISWKIGREDSNKKWDSIRFSVDGYSDSFHLCILPIEETYDPGNLFLHDKNKKSSESLPKTYSLHITLRYSNKTEDLPVTREVFHTIGNVCWYHLGKVKTNDLLEITCTFLDMQILSEAIQETEHSGETDKEKLENEEGSISGETKEDEKSHKNAKGEESNKTEGEIALIRSLSGVFLDEEYSDIILKVGEQKYPAHKVIITSRSSVFRAMLKHDMKEKNRGEIDIEDCDPHIFRDFLLYIYTGKLNNVAKDNVFDLYHMADKYDIKELRKECVDFILNNLTVDIICDAVSLGAKHCERELLSRATVFFTDNAKDILMTVNWQKFIKENPLEANELFIKTLINDNSK